MSTSSWPFGQQAAVDYLRELLLRTDLPYRQRWFMQAQRPGKAGDINAMAVARYLAEVRFMWGDGVTAKQVKDTIARALATTGGWLSPDTLTRFIDGFDMDDEHAQRLRTLLSGVDPELAQPIVGQFTSVDVSKLTAPDTTPGHRTVSLHEFHYIGADGLPERHTTIQVIRALGDGFQRYPYRFDTQNATVSVARGGHYVVDRSPVEDQLYGVDIVLQHPLRKGETAPLQCDTVFSYDPTDPPPREFRRATTSRTENLEMYLQFHQDRRPRQVWWAEWDDYYQGAQILQQEPVQLDADLSVHRYLEYIEQTVVGFYWEWD